MAFKSPFSKSAVPAEWIKAAKEYLWKPECREQLEKNGICLTPARFYNEIPTLKELEEGFENRETFPYKLTFFNKEKLVETIGQLSQFNDEFQPEVSSPNRYYWNNPAFSFSDAMAYYCFTRLLKPRTIVEIGSGFSTMVAAEAAQRNGDTSLICIEPYPKKFLLDMDVDIRDLPVQEYDPSFFNDTLQDGDILFIDSTHTVKASSDCCTCTYASCRVLREKYLYMCTISPFPED